MKKSLFAKYFTVCAAIILTSLVFLGGVFALLVSRYMRAETQSNLSQSVTRASGFTRYNYEENDGKYLDERMIRQMYSSVAQNFSGVVFFVDLEGNTLLCTEEGLCSHEVTKVSKTVLSAMSDGSQYEEYGRLGGIYSKPHYTVGTPVLVDNQTNLIGYVFCSAPADTISQLIADVVKMFLIASVFSILLSCVIIYLITRILARPLKQMSRAAKSFGQGDFSVRVNHHSSDEIGELALSFNQMADSLAELEMARKSFIANVSHELKTPMTTIGGFIDGILDGTIPKDQQEQYLKLVSDEVKRLSRLVKAMLNVTKIEAGETKLNVEPINIGDIIITTLFNFEKKIEDKNIDIKGLAEMDRIIVLGDKDLIHQVVYNLIDNAVKFCNEGGYLEFSSAKDDELAYIHIKNSGSGISREEINHVFDRFYKTDKSRSLDKNGVGLGLNIVKSILDLHGGNITVGSVLGEYTEFIIGIPLYKENIEEKRSEHRFLKK